VSAVALAPPAPTRTTPRRPVLLLPPVVEPSSSGAEAALAAITVRGVHSPVTDRPWPVVPGPAAPPLPDPDGLPGSVALAALEAIAGVRPVAQLARWVSPAVLEAVADRATPPGRAAPARRASVRRTRLVRLGPGVAEASVVLHDGTRFRAAAVRLEVHRERWRVTVLQIG